MESKYQIDQEVWCVGFKNHILKTKKVQIIDICTSSDGSIIYRYKYFRNFIIKKYAKETCFDTTEIGIAEKFKKDVFITSKKCWRNELKYLEREEKLNRIINGNSI